MRATYLLPPLLLACGMAWSQTSAPGTAASAPRSRVEARTEHIVVEDSGARIDELRVGSETKSISVQPKGRMPAYQVAPQTGERSWKVLGF